MIEKLYAHFLDSSGVTTDTRSINMGNIFFALKGPNFNGNAFALKAIQDGAMLAVVDKDNPDFEGNNRIFRVDDGLNALQDLARHHRSKLKIPVIGLTGSNGKTTTKELLNAALGKRYTCFATKGNLNNHIGVPLSLLSINRKHEIAVIEMGANHQKEIEFLCTISKPDCGLITNIGLAHLEGFGGEEGVYKGKKELFDYLVAAEAKAFVNQDDDKVVRAANDLDGITYGSNEEAFYQGEFKDEQNGLALTWWRKDRPRTKYEIQTRLEGSYNFSNALAAIAVARYFGLTPNEIKAGMEAYVPQNQRSQLEHTDRGNTVIVDCYNANPSSMLAAIENVRLHDVKSKFLILGDMLELGDQTAAYHEQVVQAIKEAGIENAILVGEHFSQANDDSFISFIETSEAATFLKDSPLSNELILLKGSRKKKLETLLELL